MPTRPLPPCRFPGCPELQVPGGHGYCRKHRTETRRQEAKNRKSSRERGYTSHYEKARAWVLSRSPLCELCKAEGRLTAATVTHHVVPLCEGGSNSALNLIPLCESCHEALHKSPKALKALQAARESTSEP